MRNGPAFHHHHSDQYLAVPRLAIAAVSESPQLRWPFAFEIGRGDVVENQLRLETEQVAQLLPDGCFYAWLLGQQMSRVSYQSRSCSKLTFTRLHCFHSGTQRRPWRVTTKKSS